MAKTFISIFMFLFLSVGMTAQEVFKQILDSSNKVLMDNHEDVGIRKIALFKVDALTYLNTQVMAEINDTTSELTPERMTHLIAMRDSQAYYMYDYINSFLKEYGRMKRQAEKDRVLRIFRDASVSNPLYNDPDRQFVLAYYNREDFLTQFSLDTDWVKAFEEVKKKLRQ